MKKKMLSLLLTLCMVLTIVPMTLLAASAEDGQSIISVTCDEPILSGFNEFDFKVTGRASKLQVIHPNGATYTVSRHSDLSTGANVKGLVSIKSYDENDTEISANSSGIAYEVWTINLKLAEGEYSVKAKYGDKWDTSAKAFTVEYVGAKVDSVKISGIANGGYNKYSVKVIGTAEKLKVTLPSGGTYTFDRSEKLVTNNSRGIVSIKAYDKSAKETDLNSTDTAYEIWTLNMKLAEGEHNFKAKYNNAWETSGKGFTVSYSAAPAEVKVVAVRGGNGSYSFELNGTAQKLQIIYASGATSTLSKTNSSVNVKYFDVNDVEVSKDSADVAYEIWTVNKKLSNGTYKVLAKYNNGTTYVWGKTAIEFDVALGEVTGSLESDKISALSAFTYEKSNDGKVKITGVKDKSVKEIVVPDFVYEIAHGAFKDCTSLEKLTVPYVGNRSNGEYYYIGYAFGARRFNQSGDVLPATLTDVTVTGGYSNDEALQSYAFYNCQNLKNIVIGDGVTYMNNSIFYDCIAMKSLTIPFIGASKKSYFEFEKPLFCWIFSENTQFDSLMDNQSARPGIQYDLWGTKSSERWGFVPKSLEEITVGGSCIPDMCFIDLKCIKKIVLREGIESIGYLPFASMPALEEVIIPDSVTYVGNSLFNGSPVDEKINESAVDGFVYLNDNILYRYIGTEKEVQIKEGITMVASNAFYKLDTIEKVSCPSTLKILGNCFGSYSIAQYAFKNCNNLKTIELNEGLEYCNALSYNSSIHACPAVENIEFPSTIICYPVNHFPDAWYNKQPDGPIYIGKVFCGYKGEMPENTTITVKEGTVSIAGRAFQDQVNLAKVELPNSLTSMGQRVFSGCTNLTDIVLPKSLTEIGYYAFDNCSSLTSINIPENLMAIPYHCFDSCSSLCQITFAEDSRLELIGESAFVRTPSDTILQIPDTVKYIGIDANGSAKMMISNPDVVFCNRVTPNTFFIGTKEEAGALADVIPCYSEIEPPYDVKNQKYTYSAWHYDENGNIAIWE